MEKKIIVDGMMCNHCKMSVEKALRAVPGVADVTVDLQSKMASVVCEDGVEDALLLAAIEKKGFTPVSIA